MSMRIFKLFLLKPSMEILDMPQDQFDELIKKDSGFKKDLGVRDLIMGGIWSDERYMGFGVELFPDWKAAREHMRCLHEVNWFKYFHADVFYGLDYADNPNKLETLDLDPTVDYLAQVWLTRTHPNFFDVGGDLMEEVNQTVKEWPGMGVVDLMSVYARPIDERYDGWGINLLPSMEVLAQKTAMQQKLKWWKYLNPETYLGTVSESELIKKEGSKS